MQYLRGFTKARLLGIAHESYVNKCEVLGNDYDVNSVTKYDYSLVTHPVSGEHCLEIEDTTYLPDIHKNRLICQEVMSGEGWFVKETVSPLEE
jgi:hypothetical protein